MEDYEAERGFLTMKGANREKKKCKRKCPEGADARLGAGFVWNCYNGVMSREQH